MQLYVYYRLSTAQAAAAQAAFEQARGPSPVELLQRPEVVDDQLTWMEIHPEAPDQSATEARIARALAPHLIGPRHVERFVRVT